MSAFGEGEGELLTLHYPKPLPMQPRDILAEMIPVYKMHLPINSPEYLPRIAEMEVITGLYLVLKQKAKHLYFVMILI